MFHILNQLLAAAAAAVMSKCEDTPGALSPPPQVESISTPLMAKNIGSARKKSAKKSAKKPVELQKENKLLEQSEVFKLDKFPKIFQTGDGALKITHLYRAIQSKNSAMVVSNQT